MIDVISPINQNNQSKLVRRRERVPVNTEKRNPKISVTVPFGNIYGINIDTLKLKSLLQQITHLATNGKGTKFDGWTDYNTYYGCERPDKNGYMQNLLTL